MNLKERKYIIDFLKYLHRTIMDRDSGEYWPGFNTSAIALYNEHEVFLTGHDLPPQGFIIEDGIYTGKWNKDFIGNTAINLNGTPTAIWDMKYIHPLTDNVKMFSVIMHELFHAYQFQNFNHLEDRCPDDISVMKYPVTPENLSLRTEERRNLLLAVFEKNHILREKYIQNFISIREKRKKLIGDILNYELGIESLEGTATYVEFMAYCTKSNLPREYLLSRFGGPLEGYTDNLIDFRFSCFSSGMFMCILLDEINPCWKIEYNSSSLNIYDFFRCNINLPLLDVANIDISSAEYLVDNENKRRQAELDDFNAAKGYRIIFSGAFNIQGFNPMNIVPVEYSTIHKTFLKFGNSTNSIFIPGKVLSYHNHHNLWKLYEVHYFSSSMPVQIDANVFIEEIGQVNGKLRIESESYIVDVANS